MYRLFWEHQDQVSLSTGEIPGLVCWVPPSSLPTCVVQRGLKLGVEREREKILLLVNPRPLTPTPRVLIQIV